jgi:hypothetical protein
MIEGLFAVALGSAVPLGFGIAAEELFRVDRRRASILAFACAVPLIIALGLPRGLLAAGLVLPWLAAVGGLGIGAFWRLLDVVRSDRLRGEPATVGFAIAVGFLAAAAGWALVDRLGLKPYGFGTTIVLLTAVHFHVAGFVLTLAAVLVARARPGPLSIGALVGLIVGTPVTALGFFGLPTINWIGAMIVAISSIAVGLATIAMSGGRGPAASRLLRVAGATLLLTMPIAAAYATGTTFGIPFLDVPAMAAIHGGLNVVGFAIPAMLGWTGLAGSTGLAE